jgi:electron transfer flavoprotein beta subunit
MKGAYVMRIIVCIKQVPASADVEVDAATGTLKRVGESSKTNPYDLFAIETALRLRAEAGGTVTALSMGPRQAAEMMHDAYRMGIDEAVVMSDQKFAGSDVLATSYTLSQGITVLGGADLIICGKQTTDGDTAQIGPAIAEHLGIPHIAWVSAIEKVTGDAMVVRQEFAGTSRVSEMRYPCLVTVEKNICVPRLPSYRLKLATADKPVRFICFDDLPDQNLSRYGLIGSPTTVERMFPPEHSTVQVHIEGSSTEKAAKLFEILTRRKFI